MRGNCSGSNEKRFHEDVTENVSILSFFYTIFRFHSNPLNLGIIFQPVISLLLGQMQLRLASEYFEGGHVNILKEGMEVLRARSALYAGSVGMEIMPPIIVLGSRIFCEMQRHLFSVALDYIDAVQ